jgi:(3,5-dihydroxyphenyl)acetyl-CoA 1,2-dioxygenase
MAIAAVAQEDLERFASLEPSFSGHDLEAAAGAASRYFQAGAAIIERLPPPPARGASEQQAASAIHERLRQVRVRFMRRFATQLYDELTDQKQRAVRIEQLVYDAADRVPGLVPSRDEIQAERQQLQKDKEGHEIDQGLFLSQLLSHPLVGLHLVYAMQRPLPESLELLEEFQRTGRVEVGNTTVERRGGVGMLWHSNPRYLNAEDDSVIRTLEIGTDLILLDPATEVGVLRGKRVEHPKYAGRHIFNAGINLTHLYQGQISFLDFFIVREMGYLHKMFRGLSGPEFWPNEVEDTLEKPWIAAVETFAIGGGCQQLLAMDRILAERSSYFNLPARKEGIIPGVSNMRLWRFVGDRLARQAILFERGFPADSPEGRMIADEVVPDGDMDAAVERTVEALLGSGVVSAAGNRKAMRIGQESIDLFRQYMAVYCREQAYCHYSPQLIANLERNWAATKRA